MLSTSDNEPNFLGAEFATLKPSVPLILVKCFMFRNLQSNHLPALSGVTNTDQLDEIWIKLCQLGSEVLDIW